jgi:NitT/TauT family transport system substrate-binding protein
MIEIGRKILGYTVAVMSITTLMLFSLSAAAAQKVTLRLDWVNSGYHAIWYYGIDKGIFQKAGIDLDVLEGNGSAVTAQTVGNGSVMFGTADTAAVMGLVSQGMPIKIVGGYLRQSPLAEIFPASKGWKSFKDMAGARIGWSPGGASAQILPAILKSAGVADKVELISMAPSAKMTALLTHRVDAIDSFDFLMVPILESKGLEAATVPYASAGINVPGLSLIANNALIKQDPALVRKMVAAMEEAITAAQQDPNAAVESLMKRAPTLDRKSAERILELSFNLVHPDWAKGKPLAWMSPQIMAKSQDILFKYGAIKKKLPADDYFSNRFLSKSAM